MNNKNFLNIHVLISHSPSCLNRDDMAMQKTAIFGGVKRVRVSSQSLKRAMRHSEYYKQHIGKSSDRTRDLEKLKDSYSEALKDRYPPELVTQAIKLLTYKKKKKKDKSDEQEDTGDMVAGENKKNVAVIPWAIDEVAYFCDLIREVNDEKSVEKESLEEKKNDLKKEEKKKSGKSSGRKALTEEERLLTNLGKYPKDSNQLLSALAKTPDIALSGRMATSELMTSIDGAFSLAHAITTHAVETDIDWFTAVDDLSLQAGETGSGHLDTQEFSAGVFYRYASLNLRQLQKNLGAVNRAQALGLAKHLVHLLVTVVPEAKQRSYAAYNLADFVLVSFGEMPISAANAFEVPIESEKGFLKPSVEAFQDYWNTIYRGYGLQDSYAVFSLLKEGIHIAPFFSTLAELEQWVERDAR